MFNNEESIASLLSSAHKESEKPGLYDNFLYSCQPLENYDQDTLRLNSRDTPFEEGYRTTAKVRGRNYQNEETTENIRLVVESQGDMPPQPTAQAIIEQEKPYFESGQIISYTVFPKAMDSIFGSNALKTIENHNGSFEIDYT